MEILNIEYLRLLEGTKRLGYLCAEMEKNIKALVEVTENLDIFWDGDANSEFVTGINEDLIEIEAMMFNERVLVKKLLEAIGEYQDTEKIVSQIVGGTKFEI